MGGRESFNAMREVRRKEGASASNLFRKCGGRDAGAPNRRGYGDRFLIDADAPADELPKLGHGTHLPVQDEHRQVRVSTPVESSRVVVTSTGVLLSGSMKLPDRAVPPGSSPVIRMTYRGKWATTSAFSLNRGGLGTRASRPCRNPRPSRPAVATRVSEPPVVARGCGHHRCRRLSARGQRPAGNAGRGRRTGGCGRSRGSRCACPGWFADG